MTRRREELLDEFKQGLQKLKTMPYITSFLTMTVRSWLSNSPIEAPNNIEHPFERLGAKGGKTNLVRQFVFVVL